MAYRIIVLGGYGHFGGRICRALAGETGVWLAIGGRDLARSTEFANSLGEVAARREAIAIDHEAAELGAQLKALQPQLVIHTSGPFQDQSYHVAEAAIAAGAHYIDLADGRAFVTGIDRLDVPARERGVLVTSGASTLPAVSAAVIDRLAQGFHRIERIEIGIAPGQATPRGLATMRSVLSYCGRPFLEWNEARWQRVFGWQGLRRLTYPRLGARWAARCDVPDLELLPKRYPQLRSVRFDASLELAATHFGLWTLAALVRSGIVRRPEAFAGPVLRLARRLDRFGSDVGAMHVTIQGIAADDRPRRSAWYLEARSGHGPEIPCIPAVVLARKLARGELAERGARPCQGMLTLDEFSEASRHLDITWRIVEDAGP